MKMAVSEFFFTASFPPFVPVDLCSFRERQYWSRELVCGN